MNLQRMFCGLLTCAALSLSGRAADKPLTVGFAQTGAESGWRLANTASMKTEAEARGISLKFVDAQGDVKKQFVAVDSFISDKVDAIVIAPLVETGWEEVLGRARAAGIPVILTDRNIRATDTSDSLWAAFIGSDFLAEGRLAAEWLVKNAGARTKIVELQGEPGSSAAQGRRRGFIEVASRSGKFKVLETVVGDFRRDKGKQMMAGLLKKHGREIEIVYSHNDDMTFGAIEAIQEAGLVPGKDIMIVSFDAVSDAVKAVIDGKINCTVECNPLFGPPVFDVVQKLAAGQKIRRVTFNDDKVIDATNAAALFPTRKY